MRVLPEFLQIPLTFMTGKPYTGQRPVALSPTFHLGAALLNMIAGVLAGVVFVRLGGGWLLGGVPACAVVLHGMRNLRMMIFHQCAHRNMYRKRGVDRVIGQCCSALLVVQSFGRYSKEHVSDHHATHHMTLRDPTVQAFLLSLGFRAGESRAVLRRKLWSRLLSPVFHTRFAVARVRSSWSGASRFERVATVVLQGGILVGLVATGNVLAYVCFWLVPLFPLFQVVNTLRLCVKHTFPDRSTTVRRGKEHFAGLTNAIFIGEAAPDGSGSPWARFRNWVTWSVRMLFVHFPSRYLVLTGDTVVHDFHHRYPACRRWFDYIFERELDVLDGAPRWPKYRHVWGMVPAIELVLESISRADPEEFDAGRIPEVSERDLFDAFDD